MKPKFISLFSRVYTRSALTAGYAIAYDVRIPNALATAADPRHNVRSGVRDIGDLDVPALGLRSGLLKAAGGKLNECITLSKFLTVAFDAWSSSGKLATS